VCEATSPPDCSTWNSFTGDHLIEGAAAVEVDLAVGLAAGVRRRPAQTPPPGRTSFAASASHFAGASVAREIATSNARAAAHVGDGLAAADVNGARVPIPSSRIAVRRNAAFFAIGSTS
jgi:hypothetical protein